MSAPKTLRPCSVCGTFYPANPPLLEKQIKELFERVPERTIQGRIRGLISPHAGYMYSGFTAACGYSLLRGKTFDRVVVVSPSHREYFDGISVFPGEAYQTPLGAVRVDEELRKQLLEASPLVEASYAGHGDEHAVEVQLPFMQTVLSEFSFLPIVLGDQRREYCFALGSALAAVLKDRKNTLLVASTDLSHYYPGNRANVLDSVMINDVRDFDPERLMQDLESGRTEACGGGPTVAVLSALKQMDVTRMDVLHHCNSGDVTGDYSMVVGYLSAVAHA